MNNIKYTIFIVFTLILATTVAQNNVGIGTNTPDPSSILEMKSNSLGFLPPRLNAVERDAIVSPEIGLIIFNTDINCIEVFDGVLWQTNCSCESYAGKISISTLNPDYCAGDSITLELDSANGLIQWQFSKSGQRFFNIENAIGNPCKVASQSCISWYRAKVNDGNCDSKFSDTLLTQTENVDKWSEIQPMPIGRNQAFVFVIKDKAYVMGGQVPGSFQSSKNVYEYNSETNVWVQMADMPKLAMGGGAFSLFDKGYVVGGHDDVDGKNVWEYNPKTNSWKVKSDLPAAGRYWNITFAINNIGYTLGGILASSSNTINHDFYAYYPKTDKWIKLVDFPANSADHLTFGSATVCNGKAYVYAGNNHGGGKEFWEYDPSLSQWTLLGNIPFSSPRFGPFAFTICDNIYFGGGDYSTLDFWRYDPKTGNWTNMANLLESRRVTLGFSVNGKGFFGTGSSASGSSGWFKPEFWKYCP